MHCSSGDHALSLDRWGRYVLKLWVIFERIYLSWSILASRHISHRRRYSASQSNRILIIRLNFTDAATPCPEKSGPTTAMSRPGGRQHTTAPVLEYICLFTHDLKRKQKRWQDGRMKFHSFNKRVIVYDDRGNFVGDAHWREDYAPQDGDDLNLDQGATLVQISECVSSKDQDLSELVDKRIQDRLDRHTQAQARQSLVSGRNQQPPIAHVPPRLIQHTGPRPPQPHLKHVPLSNIIGTPAGQLGRAAVPVESPYDVRQKQDARSPTLGKGLKSSPNRAGFARICLDKLSPSAWVPLAVPPYTGRFLERPLLHTIQGACQKPPVECAREQKQMNTKEQRIILRHVGRGRKR